MYSMMDEFHDSGSHTNRAEILRRYTEQKQKEEQEKLQRISLLENQINELVVTVKTMQRTINEQAEKIQILEKTQGNDCVTKSQIVNGIQALPS
ncbi:hypothetical protein BLNAU_24809 [Blattamonas nauphoetae]|uniref:Uncharacterized protein n=1 Tax=Blattamonas nauphoetae TaxID=2049346 RepID=A0ABQ9WLE1_9EUKA|nr:hypothetical protein BLNAU_24809 [Blattamonas nauphoetae]